MVEGELLGMVIFLWPQGEGKIQAEGTNNIYCFDFSCLKPDGRQPYGGQHPRELDNFSPEGLTEGCLVMFVPSLETGKYWALTVRPIAFGNNQSLVYAKKKKQPKNVRTLSSLSC